MVSVTDRLNAAVAYSPVGRWFQLEVRASGRVFGCAGELNPIQGSGAVRERVGSRFVVRALPL
jgi:hypothetical protein